MKVRHFKEDSKIKIEVLDDLWFLKSVLDRGDLVSGVSYRRIRDETKMRADKGKRLRVFLTVRVEDSQFHESSKSLRVTGEIIHSSDESVSHGSHHTLEVGVGDSITVKKDWKKWQLDRLREAEKSSGEGIVLLVAVEEGEAEFAVLRRYGIDYTFRISAPIPGKEMEKIYVDQLKDFYRSVADKIEGLKKQEGVTSAILCGPGFAKDKIFDILKSRRIGGVFLESAGCGGRPGIQEVLKRGALERIAQEARVGVETRLVEELFRGISKETLASYGIKEVERAAEIGAVKDLLVTYTFLQKYDPDRLLESVKKRGGRVMVISPEHEAGERLDAIGGIGALLRFPVPA